MNVDNPSLESTNTSDSDKIRTWNVEVTLLRWNDDNCGDNENNRNEEKREREKDATEFEDEGEEIKDNVVIAENILWLIF